MKRLPSLLIVLLFSAAAQAAGPAIDAAYKAVDIDDYTARQRPLAAGTRTLLPPQYIVFTARIDQPPRPAKTEYLKLALSVLGIADAPAINHQMMLATPGGRRLPVYVEDALVQVLAQSAPVQTESRFHGYHIYTYSKGPAIVISGYQPK